MAKNTRLFRLHHAEARAASRRLHLLFWFGVLLSAVFYFALSFGLFGLILGFPSDATRYMAQHTLRIAALISGFCVFVVIMEYMSALGELKKHTAAELAKNLFAKPLPITSQPSFRVLQNVVEEMAIAGGMSVPPVFYLPEDKSINAFVLGGKNHSVAIVVSKGLIDHLSRDEQQAIIAHEFGHISNEDVFIYAQLSAVLRGYYAIGQWRHTDAQVSVARENIFQGVFSNDSDGYSLLDLFRKLFGYTGFFLAFIGERIQAAFSREREWMADARAVQYTRNPEALVMAFKKALALQTLNQRPLKIPDSKAHHLFINYFNNRLATHPPLKKRIERYGGRVDPREIDALAFNIHNQRSYNGTDNPVELNRHAFKKSAMLFPILTIQQKQRRLTNAFPSLESEELLAAILAFFVYHSGIDNFTVMHGDLFADINQKILYQQVERVENTDPVAQLPQFILLLSHLKALKNPSFMTRLKKYIPQLIKYNGVLSFYEWCYFVVLNHHLKEKVVADKKYQDIETSLYAVLALIASRATPEVNCPFSKPTEEDIEAGRAKIYHDLIVNTLPLPANTYVPPNIEDNHGKPLTVLAKQIAELATLKPVYRQSLLEAIEQHWQKQLRLSMEEIFLQTVLRDVLN